ncbi:MAG TPA: DNA polymerase IV [Casimicrobiaceae bacterium]|nr:DNA polymerase IV [Casimicrobiaceae bacterium]
MSGNVIAHLDMDAFYASVELLRYPELRGKPVVIGGSRRHQPVEYVDPVTHEAIRSFATLRGYTGRGVITTATYEARAFGVHSAMGMMKAAALAPDAVLLPVDFDAYRHHSRLFKAAVRNIAPHIEDRGIDEIYVDLTTLVADADARARGDTGAPASDRDHVRTLAQSIKDAVRNATGLSCSIGVAANKLLAKIASDLDKPDGLTILDEADLQRRIWPLLARRINGIGPKSSARLESHGIRTIGDLAAADPSFLIATFGRAHGEWMHAAAHGRDDRPVVTHSEPRSISRETTFDRDLLAARDREQLSTIFTELCEGVADDLRRKGYAGRTIGVKLRYDNFAIVTRAHTLGEATSDANLIRRTAGDCLRRVDLTRRIRLLGVRVGALARADSATVLREPEPDRPPALFD